MAIPWVPVPEGTRVRVKQGNFPQDPAIVGRVGTVVLVSEYQPQSTGVVLDGSTAVHHFTPAELEVITEPALSPEREAAKQKRALP